MIDWPHYTRYAVWNVCKDVGEKLILRGYVEFKTPVKEPKTILKGSTFSKRECSRDDARNMHLNPDHDGSAGPWEFGEWELLRPGRRPKRAFEPLRSVVVDKEHSSIEGVYKWIETVSQNVELLHQVMKDSVKPLTIIQNNQHFNINSNNNMITNNVIIKDLRSEDLSDFSEERMRELILQTRSGFLTFVKETRFNPEKPENRNVKILSKKKNLAAVKKAGEWQQNSIAQALEEVLDVSKAQFFKPLDDPSYMDHLIETDHPVMDWCQKLMSKKPCEWRPIKNSVRAELERVYNT